MMKCVFTINDKSETTYPLLKAAINSLQTNTTLEPVIIWSGGEHSMLEWLDERGVQIVRHELSFKQQIEHFDFWEVDYLNEDIKNMYKFYPNYYNKNFIETESLRIDIPILFDKESYVLYADCDVLFLKNIEIEPFDEHIAVVKRHIFNNGIMFLNMAKMRECYDEFKNYYINSNYNSYLGIATQGVYNEFFNEKIHTLPWYYNWHVFWGINPNTKILHYCGPKPKDYFSILKGLTKLNDYEIMYQQCLKSAKQSYIDQWNYYAEPCDRLI